MKNFLGLLLMVVLLTSYDYSLGNKGNNKRKPAYKIQIKVKGLPKDSVCYLAYYFGDKQYLQDTAKIGSNGKFVFEGDKELPSGMYLVAFSGKRLFDFIVKEQVFSIETDTNDYEGHMKVKGSEENKLFYDFLKFNQKKGLSLDSIKKEQEKVKDDKQASEKLNSRKSQIEKEIFDNKTKIINQYPQKFIGKLFNATRDPELPKDYNKSDSLFPLNYYRTHYFDNIDFTDDGLLRTPIYNDKVKFYFENLTYRHVDSINKAADFLVAKTKANKEIFKYTLIWITNNYESSNWMGADAIFVHMVERYYMNNQAFWLDSTKATKINDRGMLLKPLLIGKVAPNLFLQDTLGRNSWIHDLKSKFTVLFFYDPDCGHCQKATPVLQEFYKEYKWKGVEVIAITSHGEESRWRKFIKEHKLEWINLRDNGPYYKFDKVYDVYSTPVIYILNEKKEIIAKRIAVEQIKEVIDNYIKWAK